MTFDKVGTWGVGRGKRWGGGDPTDMLTWGQIKQL